MYARQGRDSGYSTDHSGYSSGGGSLGGFGDLTADDINPLAALIAPLAALALLGAASALSANPLLI